MYRELGDKIWDKKNKKWFMPIYEAYKNNLCVLYLNYKGDLIMECIGKQDVDEHTHRRMIHESIFPNRFEVLRYTGIKDKNDKEIYEGDIIFDIDYGYMTCTYMNGTFIWYSSKGFGIKFMNYIPAIEVVGNKYENANLISE